MSAFRTRHHIPIARTHTEAKAGQGVARLISWRHQKRVSTQTCLQAMGTFLSAPIVTWREIGSRGGKDVPC